MSSDSGDVKGKEVQQRFIGTSAVTRHSRNRTSMALINDVDDVLGKPDRLAWFYDEELGRMYVIPASEVGDG